MKPKKFIPSLIITVLLLIAAYWFEQNGDLPGSQPAAEDTDVVQLRFPSERFPETARHIQEAIRSGESSICTIDRQEADENRKESLKGVPTKKGYDRDEWPMAMCKEGGSGADIEYITPSDNRGAGSWVGNQLEGLPDGTRVQFMFK